MDSYEFEREANRILKDVENECVWMYITLHKPSEEQLKDAIVLLKSQNDMKAFSDDNFPIGKINYTVWSEFIRCASCGNEEPYWFLAVDQKTRYKKGISELIQCPACNSGAPFREWEKVLETSYDETLGRTITMPK